VWRRHQREGGLDAHVRLAEIAHARARGAEGADAASSPDPVAPADVRAGGGVVIRTGAAGPEVLIVHRPRYDDWSLPKGKAYEGESVEDAARREVFEETGLRCELDRELPSVRYLDRQGLTKLVRYWLMWPVEGSFVPNDEVDAVQWVPVDDVRTLVTYDRDVAVVEAAAHTLG
jgi:8-oxo-dGTP diphosphatase